MAEIPVALTRAMAEVPNLVFQSSWGCLSRGPLSLAVCGQNHWLSLSPICILL